MAAIDADLIRGVTDRIVVDRVQVVGGILQIEYRDESNVRQTLDYLPSTGGSSNYFPIPDGDVGGTANAITLTTGESLSAYANGQMFFFNSSSSNTGAVTVNVDGIGTRPVNRSSGQGSGEELVGAEITANDPILFVYGTQFNAFYMIPGHIGTAAQRNVGDSEHQLPVLQSDDSLTAAHIAPGGSDGDLLVRTATGKEWRIGGLDDLRVIPTYADLPTPSAATEGIFYYIESDKDIFVTESITEYGVGQVGSFDELTQTHVQVFDNQPQPAAQYADQYIYAENLRHFYVGETAAPYDWFQVSSLAALQALRSVNTYDVNFMGQTPSDPLALARIPTIFGQTDYFYVNTSNNTIRRLDLSSYSPAVTPATIYEWVFAVAQVIPNPPGVTSGTSLAYMQFDGVNYRIGDLVGFTTTYRDQYTVADYAAATRATDGRPNGRQRHSDRERTGPIAEFVFLR